MSVYVITGVSRGIGFELLKRISDDPANLLVGLVRDKAGTEEKVAAELGDRPNVHILHGDLASYASLKQAAAEAAGIVGGRGVDYLVANGAIVSTFDGYDPIGVLGEKPEELDAVAAQVFQVNVVGNIHLFNLFLPLVQQGRAKKVVAVSSGHAALDLINTYEIDNAALYAASKAALNIVVAKFHAQYKKEGILFLSISPGIVDVGHGADATPEQMQNMMGMLGKLAAYAPHLLADDGKPAPATPPAEAIPQIRAVWEKASLENGDGGAFVSHFGNQQWL